MDNVLAIEELRKLIVNLLTPQAIYFFSLTCSNLYSVLTPFHLTLLLNGSFLYNRPIPPQMMGPKAEYFLINSLTPTTGQIVRLTKVHVGWGEFNNKYLFGNFQRSVSKIQISFTHRIATTDYSAPICDKLDDHGEETIEVFSRNALITLQSIGDSFFYFKQDIPLADVECDILSWTQILEQVRDC
jgi:hypothetical protein